MTKGNKRIKKKETRRNAEIDRKFAEVEAAKEAATNVKRESNYISYLKKDELYEIKVLLKTDVLDDCDLLLGAVAIGNFSVVKKLLKHGCQINCRGKSGWTCLMWAVKCKRLEMVDLLIKRCADITASNIEGDNAMLLAIQSDGWHQDAFLDLWNTISRFSCSFNEVVNHANKKGYTLLHFSVKRQWENIVDRLIEDGADVNCINHRGITPLMIAGYCGDATLIRRLLRSKANVLLEDKRGCTAACYAIAFMLPKHAEISHTLNDKLADEFSIFTPMMVSEEIYLKRRLDLLVYPPNEDFSSTIKKVIVPLTSFFVRFNKDGLLLLLELQVFGRIQEAIERHIEDAEYVKALMAVTLELVRDCQCCINELLPMEVGKSFVVAGIPEACLRILKKHDQTSVKDSVINATMLPLISVCTSRGLSGKMWLQNNYKHFIPFYQNYNKPMELPFKILADDLHKNLLKQSIKDFEELVQSLESGQLIVENLESFKSDENSSKTGSEVNSRTISNPGFVSPSFIDFLSEKCCPEINHINEPSVALRYDEEINQSPQNSDVKGVTTEGYTNLTELFMSRKMTDKKIPLLRIPRGANSCLDENRETLEPECKNGENIMMAAEKVNNNINTSHKPISDRTLLKSRIEDGKTFSSVLQQNIKIEKYTKTLTPNCNHNANSGQLMETVPENLRPNLEITEATKPVIESGVHSSKFVDELKSLNIDSFFEEINVKNVEGRYKNPISNFLWSLDVDDCNPITERPNISKGKESLETNIPLFKDYCNIDCSDNDEAKTKAKAESDAELARVVAHNERKPTISKGRRQLQELPVFKDNYNINCTNNVEENKTKAKTNNYYEGNSTLSASTKSLLEPKLPIFKYDYCIDCSDDEDNCKTNYEDCDDQDHKIYDFSNDKNVCSRVEENFSNYQKQKYEAEVAECNSFNRKNVVGSDLNATENNMNENITKGFCIQYSENPGIIGEQKFLNKEEGCKIKECSLNELDSQMEKLDKQVKHIINQYEMLCKKDFENGYPKAQGGEEGLLELMTSLPLVELSHLKNLKQKWNELREKLTTKSKQNLSGVVKNAEKYLESFSESLDKKIDTCRILNEPKLSDIGDDLKYSRFNNTGKDDDQCSNNHDKVIIEIYDKSCNKNIQQNVKPDYNWFSVFNNENDSENDENFDLYDECFEQPREILKRGDTNERDFDRAPPGYTSDPIRNPRNKFVREERPNYESLLIEDRKSMYCSQNYLDSIINLMNLHGKNKEVFGNGTLIMAASSTYPKYKLREGGNFGTVELGMDQEGFPLAVKRLIRCKTKTMEMITSTLKTLLYEMRSLHHPHIVPYVNYVETEFNVMIAMPLCEKNLDEYIEELKECHDLGNHSLDLVHQMMKGLQYLHSRTPPIIHGNLKPTNILIDSKQTVRLADFGLHKILFKQKSPHVDGMIWWAQETYLTYKNTLKMVCTLQSDIQVAGILMHYIITGGIHPFGRPDSILMDDPSVLAPALHTINCEANDLLTWMLEHVNNRPTIDQAMSHILFWSDERKWEFILACSGVDSNYEESLLPLDEFSKFINQRALEEKSEGNWATIIQQNFPEHYITASRCCDPESVSGLLLFINLSILNTETEFGHKFRKVISFAFPNLPLCLFRFIEDSEWETHPDLIKYSHHSLY